MGDCPAEEDFITVGRIVKAHGIAGEVAVVPETDFIAERFAPGSVFNSSPREKLTVQSVRPQNDRLLISFEEVDDRTRAESLAGQELLVSETEAFELPVGDYYGFQIIGLTAFNREGQQLGKIVGIEDAAGRSILEIENNDGRIIDFPAAFDLIDQVDIEAGEIILKLPSGWEKLIRP